MTILYTLLFTVAGALLYRLRGAPWLTFLHRPIKQMLYCSGWATVGYLITPDWWWLLAYAASVGVVCMGHGAYMDLGNTVDPAPDQLDERPVKRILAFIQRLISRSWKQNSYTYDAVGLAINGTLMTLPFGILFFSAGHPIAALIVTVAGTSKFVAYHIGWEHSYKISIGDMGIGATEVGEYLTGAFQWLAFALAYLWVVS